MSGPGEAPRRPRPRVTPSVEQAVRDSEAEALKRPAGEFLDAMPWAGPSPDPDVLDAVTFLAWL